MSTHELSHHTPDEVENKLTILETVLRHNNVRLSTLTKTLSLDDGDTHAVLSELRDADLVSTCPLRNEDDSVVTSLPRLRGYERTKLYGLLYN